MRTKDADGNKPACAGLPPQGSRFPSFGPCTRKGVAADTRFMMSDRRDRIEPHAHRFDLDEVMRLTAVVGFVALTTWILTSSVGVLSGYLAVSPPATLRFLLAVSVLVFARRTYWAIREW